MDFDNWVGKLLMDREPPSHSTEEIRRKNFEARDLALRKLGFWATAIFVAVTLSGILTGDDLHLRLTLFCIWVTGFAFGEWARRLGKLNLATLAYCMGGWIMIGLAAWKSGAYNSPAMSVYILIIFCAGGVGGRRLTFFVGLLSLGATLGMWGLSLAYGIPPSLLDRSRFGSLPQQIGVIAFSLIVALLLLRKLRAAAAAAAAERELTLKIGESFKELFIKSPAPMALTEERARDADQARKGLATNDAFKATFDIPPEYDDGGRGYHADLWHPDDLQEARRLVGAHGSIDRFRARMRSSDGTERICLVSTGPVHWEGDKALLWTFQDVTSTEELRAKLENANSDLERRVENKAMQLEMARKELERSERLSKLGEMVAGVAHEVNTPIGNALLAASTLSETTRRLSAMASGNALSRTELNVLCKRLRETGDLTMENLERAGDIIKSFKQLSSDQTSQARREFRLREVLEGAFKAMGPSLRGSAVSWELDMDAASDEAVFAGFPGALSQIATCLAANALMHAFDGPPAPGKKRLITARARIVGGRALISFSDNGSGIPKALATKIFEPFFTTKAGRGGTGLGLAVAWNLAREALGGELALADPQPDEGCRMDLGFPLIGPLRIAEPSSESN